MILRFDTELGYKSLIKVFIFSNNILYALVDLETIGKILSRNLTLLQVT